MATSPATVAPEVGHAPLLRRWTGRRRLYRRQPFSLAALTFIWVFGGLSMAIPMSLATFRHLPVTERDRRRILRTLGGLLAALPVIVVLLALPPGRALVGGDPAIAVGVAMLASRLGGLAGALWFRAPLRGAYSALVSWGGTTAQYGPGVLLLLATLGGVGVDIALLMPLANLVASHTGGAVE